MLLRFYPAKVTLLNNKKGHIIYDMPFLTYLFAILIKHTSEFIKNLFLHGFLWLEVW